MRLDPDLLAFPGIAGPSDDTKPLLERLAALVPAWQENAAALDAESRFPEHELRQLHEIGGFRAAVPRRHGGQGIGTEPEGAVALLNVLRLIGRGNLSVGRLFEGHVNALKLVAVFGTEAQQAAAARDAGAGRRFGLWVTDDPADPVCLRDGTLSGAKGVCSGAGHMDRALITATMPDETIRMLVVPLQDGVRTRPTDWSLLGMHAATTGRVEFDAMPVGPDALLGEAGDYLRQPYFSAGAWRTSAVTLGGLEALAAQARAQLASRGRDADPHQRARMGQVLLAQETARLWMRQAAVLAESDAADAGDVVAYVNLARLALERACLDTIELVQRSLGLAAFARPNPVERLCRDLETYLRQPAPDETLTEAARHFMLRDLPQDEAGA